MMTALISRSGSLESNAHGLECVVITGCIEKKNVCFKRIHVIGMYPDGDCSEGKDGHVWMDIFMGL